MEILFFFDNTKISTFDFSILIIFKIGNKKPIQSEGKFNLIKNQFKKEINSSVLSTFQWSALELNGAISISILTIIEIHLFILTFTCR